MFQQVTQFQKVRLLAGVRIVRTRKNSSIRRLCVIYFHSDRAVYQSSRREKRNKLRNTKGGNSFA